MTKVLVATEQTTVDLMIREEDRQRLESMADVTWHTNVSRKTSEDDYLKAISEASPDIIMTGWGSPRLTPRVLEANPQLKCLINITGTLRQYLDPDCYDQGLRVTNWGDVPAASVAEAALMMTLASLRKTYHWQIKMHQEKIWEKDTQGPIPGQWIPQGLFDKTVGLYGFGKIAREYAKMLKPFDVELLVLSSYINEDDKQEFGIEKVASLKELFSRSDVVAVHTGNRPDTHHSVNAEILASMKDGGHIINTARGAIIDTDALVEELKKERLFAALDVYEEEPLPNDHPLRGLPTCLLFPHQGGPTSDYRWRCGAEAVNQVERYIKGEELKHQVTREHYEKTT